MIGANQDRGYDLYYYGARWYDPELGRFTQSDILFSDLKDAKALDRDAYVYNNPLKNIDPSGLCGFELKGYDEMDKDQQLRAQADFEACERTRLELQSIYQIVISGIWSLMEMQALEVALDVWAPMWHLVLAGELTEIARGDRDGSTYLSGAPNSILTFYGSFIEIFDSVYDGRGYNIDYFLSLPDFRKIVHVIAMKYFTMQ